MRRVAILAATLVPLATAAPAWAHVEVDRTTPGKGRTVERPESATVTFTGPIRKGTLRVTGPGGKAASVDAGARDPRDVTRLLVELRSGLKAGTYKASWSIVAGDGHAEKGSFTFRVKR